MIDDCFMFFPGMLFCTTSSIGFLIGKEGSATIGQIGMICYLTACIVKILVNAP